MFPYIKILELFLLQILFNKDEYNFNSRKFNPLKILVVITLATFPVTTIYLYGKLSDAYVLIEHYCPNLAKDISNGANKKDLIEKVKKENYICNK